jgi:glycosyltransferase involved in cell wall biosynthesis
MLDYIIITPAKDEGKYIRFTLNSVIGQTVLPKKWIIVDDASTDDTAEIVKSFIQKYSWIQLVQNDSEYTHREGGAKVVNAFYKGFETIKNDNFDIIVKLDADLTIPSSYFEIIIKEFEKNPHLGMCGGYCIILENNKPVREYSDSYHIRGAFKSIQSNCFRDIGGFKSIWSWDGIDELTALYKGWETKVLEVEVLHHRPTSKAYNLYKHSFKSGLDSYLSGNDLGLTCIRCIVRITQKPIFIGGFLFLLGFLYAWIKREKKYVDKDLARFIRKFHYNRVLTKLKLKNINDK